MNANITPLFLALKPDPDLWALLDGHKRRVRDIAGPQLYLDDPPHLTVYLAHFPEGTDALGLVKEIIDSEPPPRVRLVGWHTFESDALTGLNTLVCAIHPNDKCALRHLQGRLVNALAPARDGPSTESRFGPRLANLTPEQRSNIRAHGFPFLGDGWEPHFTIASIRPTDWPTVTAALAADPPVGDFTCPILQEFELEGLHPRLRASGQFHDAH